MLTHQQKFIINSIIIAAATTLVIALAVILPSATDKPVSTRVSLAFIGVVFLGWAIFMRSYKGGLMQYSHSQRVYLVEGVVVRPSANSTKIGDSASFFAPHKAGAVTQSSTLCSICLCEASGKEAISSCCHNPFHKRCLRMYWETIGVIRCPNCRFELGEGQTVSPQV